MATNNSVDESVVLKEKIESLYTAVQSESSGKFAPGTVTKSNIAAATVKVEFSAPIEGKAVKICTVYCRDRGEYVRGDVVMASPNDKTVAFNLLMEQASHIFTFVSKFDNKKGLVEKTEFRKGYDFCFARFQDESASRALEVDSLKTALQDIGKVVADKLNRYTQPDTSPSSPANNSAP